MLFTVHLITPQSKFNRPTTKSFGLPQPSFNRVSCWSLALRAFTVG